ncbi:hypothetical protein [Pedobacter sp. MR2016-24]|uniref:hypothetical protein n=1 Tax=Pedobacter sp. MR2016-24 TaxID=2994466 RepID=UPI002246FE46|nr:hypothetical protein [Pedobacter sp. MR2016-24]MCX2485992.1 hypothetical protein [Pedobacter sp. MR2016-24]
MGKITGFILMLFLFSACGKETNQVPNVAVNLVGFFSPDQLSALKANGAIFMDGGVAGVIIAYNSLNGYKAYDRCSTVNPENRCAVTLDNAYTVTDPCTGAKYSLLDGTPSKAPAKIALRTYSILVTGNNYQVTN